MKCGEKLEGGQGTSEGLVGTRDCHCIEVELVQRINNVCVWSLFSRIGVADGVYFEEGDVFVVCEQRIKEASIFENFFCLLFTGGTIDVSSDF